MAGQDSTGDAMPHQPDGAIKAGWAQKTATLGSRTGNQICLHVDLAWGAANGQSSHSIYYPNQDLGSKRDINRDCPGPFPRESLEEPGRPLALRL